MLLIIGMFQNQHKKKSPKFLQSVKQCGSRLGKTYVARSTLGMNCLQRLYADAKSSKAGKELIFMTRRQLRN